MALCSYGYCVYDFSGYMWHSRRTGEVGNSSVSLRAESGESACGRERKGRREAGSQRPLQETNEA